METGWSYPSVPPALRKSSNRHVFMHGMDEVRVVQKLSGRTRTALYCVGYRFRGNTPKGSYLHRMTFILSGDQQLPSPHLTLTLLHCLSHCLLDAWTSTIRKILRLRQLAD